tara:strand:- start:180 stop:482 length:303 start_codon:yes stop_codon:yes gene_type:complete
MAKAKEKVERRSPTVYGDMMAAIFGADGDDRPIWRVEVGTDAYIVRASTANQARQAVLVRVAVPKRIKQDQINSLLLESQRQVWKKENGTTDKPGGVEDD